MCVCVVSWPYMIHFPTAMARYSLFVLKVPLNTKQTNFIDNWDSAHAILPVVGVMKCIWHMRNPVLAVPISQSFPTDWNLTLTQQGTTGQLDRTLDAFCGFDLLSAWRGSRVWTSLPTWMLLYCHIRLLLCLGPDRADALSDAFVSSLTSVCHVHRA